MEHGYKTVQRKSAEYFEEQKRKEQKKQKEWPQAKREQKEQDLILDYFKFGIESFNADRFSGEFLKEFYERCTEADALIPHIEGLSEEYQRGAHGTDTTGKFTGKILNGIGKTFDYTATVVGMVLNVHNHMCYLINKLRGKADPEYWEKQWAAIHGATGIFMKGVCNAELGGVVVIELAARFFTLVANMCCDLITAKTGFFNGIKESVTMTAAKLNVTAERLRRTIEKHESYADELIAKAGFFQTPGEEVLPSDSDTAVTWARGR